MIDANSTVDNHYKVHKSASLLDILIEFDQFLDDLNVYSYQNWFDGEVVDGPHLTRYWCEISLMYPYADEEELQKGYQQGLDDETRQTGNAGEENI